MPQWPTEPFDDTQAPSRQPAPRHESAAWSETVTAGVLMVACVGLLVGAMFPPYSGNGASTTPTVVSMPYETALYVCLEVGWALAALLVLSRLSVRGGVALGAGLAAVQLGLLVTDVTTGLAVSNGSAPGVWLAVSGLGAGTAGVLFGASCVPMGRPRLRVTDASTLPRALLALTVSVLAVAAYWPPWDQYYLVSLSGGSGTFTQGNVFLLPAGPMSGGIEAGLAIAVVVMVAGWWAPPQVGGWLILGVAVALSAQLISGYVQIHEPLSDVMSTTGLNLARSTQSLTGYWTADALAAVALVALAVWCGVAGGRRAAHDDPGAQPAGGDPTRHDWPPAHHWPEA
jgi:hypothetical protein